MERSLRRGQVLLKAPFLLIVFLGFAAFAVDTGFVHLRRATAQSAAESVALAAAYRASASRQSSYGGSFPTVEASAAPLAQLNAAGCRAPIFEWGVWSTAKGFQLQPVDGGGTPLSGLKSAVRVSVSYDQPMFFGGVFGRRVRSVLGRAVVTWTPYGDVWPVALASRTDFTAGRIITFGVDPSNIVAVQADPFVNVPGNKGWLAFNTSTNAPDLETYTDGGPYGPGIPSPWVATTALNQTSSAPFQLATGQQGASIVIEGTPGLKAALKRNVSAQVNAGSVVLIPIYDSATGQGSHADYKIVGLVPVQLIPPYVDLDLIRARVLSQGAYWFPPNTNIAAAFQNWMNPAVDLTMVE